MGNGLLSLVTCEHAELTTHAGCYVDPAAFMDHDHVLYTGVVK